MTPLLPSLLLLAVAQEHGPQSLAVRVADPYGVLGPDWRVHAELEMADGRPANGRRPFDARGAAHFASVPPGEGELTLEWLPPGSNAEDARAWQPVLRRPLAIEAGRDVAVEWDFGSELALVRLVFADPPADLEPEDVSLFHLVPAPPGTADEREADWTPESFEPARLPVPVGATVFAAAAVGSGVMGGMVLLDSWTVAEAGAQTRELRFPSGSIEVRLAGKPPQGDEDWRNSFLVLEADPRTTAQWTPIQIPVRPDGSGAFRLVAPGDYFVKLAWSEDGDDWFTEEQIARLIRFEGGALRLDFAASGTGSAEILPPTETDADSEPANDRSEELHLKRMGTGEVRTVPWPAAGEAIRIADLPVGRWTARATRAGSSTYAFFEVEPDRVARLDLPPWTPQIPVILRWEGRASELDPRFWIVDPSGGFVSTLADCLDAWSGPMAPGRGRVVVQRMFGPRSEVNFDVPAALPEGQQAVEFVIRLDG